MFDERTNALKRKYGEAKIASLLGGIRYSEKMTLKFRVRTMHGSKCRKGSATRTTATAATKAATRTTAVATRTTEGGVGSPVADGDKVKLCPSAYPECKLPQLLWSFPSWLHRHLTAQSFLPS